MPRMAVLLVAIVVLSLATELRAQETILHIQDLATAQEFQHMGLGKLTEAELDSLNSWLTRFAMAITQIASDNSAPSATPRMYAGKRVYIIEAAVNDETFIINGEVYEAKTYCFGFDKGDGVVFLEGSPFGACATAKIMHIRTKKTCHVWCE